MASEPHVIGVGDADMDIFMEVTHLPAYDEKLMAHGVHRAPGGMVANTLVALARLGTRTTFVGCVGEDEYGRLIAENFQREGVALDGLRIVSGQRTYFCVILLDASGEKSLILAPEPTMYPPLNAVSPSLLRQGTHVHTTASPQVSTSVIARAVELGLTVSVDLDAASRGLAAYRQILKSVTVVFLNERGRQNLASSASVKEVVVRLLELGVRCVVVTQGATGAVVATHVEQLRTNGWPVAVRDTTGGGDCFAGAFLHGYLRGWVLQDTLRFANATAALCLQAIGAQTGMPKPSDVQRLLASDACPALEAL